MSNDLPSPQKLAWMCRRGLLELDILLTRLRENVYPELSDMDKQHFCTMLEIQDPKLLRYLMGQESPDTVADPAVQALIIRLAA